MKTYKKLYNKVCDRENIRKAILKASEKKRDRPDVKEVLDNIDYHIEVVHMLLVDERYNPISSRPSTIKEGSRSKKRTIRKTRFAYDQIIHHCIIQVLSPIFLKGAYEFSCGSIPNKGSHYAKRYICKWIRDDHKNTKYVCKMDIKSFYASVDHGVLKACLSRNIKDKKLLRLLFLIIDSCDEGLPLGYYTSQWFANFLLQDLDHAIKEKLGIVYYVRYMDDMVIFGRNKKELHKARLFIEEYLSGELGLTMKKNWQVFRLGYLDKSEKLHGRALDFMGFRFYRHKTTLRRSIMLRATRKARKIGRKTLISGKEASGMISYMGWVSDTQTYGMYEKWIKPYVSIKKMKNIVRKEAKKKEQEKKKKVCT